MRIQGDVDGHRAVGSRRAFAALCRRGFRTDRRRIVLVGLFLIVLIVLTGAVATGSCDAATDSTDAISSFESSGCCTDAVG